MKVKKKIAKVADPFLPLVIPQIEFFFALSWEQKTVIWSEISTAIYEENGEEGR